MPRTTTTKPPLVRYFNVPLPRPVIVPIIVFAAVLALPEVLFGASQRLPVIVAAATAACLIDWARVRVGNRRYTSLGLVVDWVAVGVLALGVVIAIATGIGVLMGVVQV
jgi:hypothetical protein